MEPVRRGQPTPKSPTWMGTVSDLLILSGFKREFSKYPKPARRLVSAAILVNVAGRAGSQAGERFTWPEAGDGALGGGDGTAGAPRSIFQGAPRSRGRQEQHACVRRTFLSKAESGKWPGAGRWHACRHCRSHHYRIQQSRRTMLIIMENGFPFWGGGEGGREGSSRRGWGQV